MPRTETQTRTLYQFDQELYDMARAEEYEQAAEWCARRGYAGALGDPLPSPLASEVCEAINADVEAFQARVRAYRYALAMEALNLPEDES